MTKEKNHSILIIDDDAFLLDMYALKFTQEGFTVSTSPGTIQALELLQDGASPEILLVDIVMPTMDGFEFLARIKEEKLVPNALKVVLSNLGQQEDIDRGLALGAVGYIVKASATPSEVVQKVKTIVEKQS